MLSVRRHRRARRQPTSPCSSAPAHRHSTTSTCLALAQKHANEHPKQRKQPCLVPLPTASMRVSVLLLLHVRVLLLLHAATHAISCAKTRYMAGAGRVAASPERRAGAGLCSARPRAVLCSPATPIAAATTCCPQQKPLTPVNGAAAHLRQPTQSGHTSAQACGSPHTRRRVMARGPSGGDEGEGSVVGGECAEGFGGTRGNVKEKGRAVPRGCGNQPTRRHPGRSRHRVGVPPQPQQRPKRPTSPLQRCSTRTVRRVEVPVGAIVWG